MSQPTYSLYSPVFMGVCLSMTLVTYSSIEPGWPLGICVAAVMAVGIISFIITMASLWLFEYLELPNWVKYLLLFCLVTQWPVFLALLQNTVTRDSLPVLVFGGVAYFFWPVLGVLLGRNIGRRWTHFTTCCWIFSLLLLFSCFTPVFR